MNSNQSRGSALAGGVGVLCALILSVAAEPVVAKKKTIESFSANAFVMDGTPGGKTATLTVNIYRWTTPEEEQELVDAVKEATEAGPRARKLPNALRKQKKTGYVFLTGETGYPLRYAEENDTPNGRQVVVATDRPMTFSEIYAGSQVRDYDITVIVLYVDKGEGIASVGTEIVWNDVEDDIQITNVSSQPVKLGGVRSNQE